MGCTYWSLKSNCRCPKTRSINIKISRKVHLLTSFTVYVVPWRSEVCRCWMSLTPHQTASFLKNQNKKEVWKKNEYIYIIIINLFIFYEKVICLPCDEGACFLQYDLKHTLPLKIGQTSWSNKHSKKKSTVNKI